MDKRILLKILANPKIILFILSIALVLFSEGLVAGGDDPGQGVTDPDPLG